MNVSMISSAKALALVGAALALTSSAAMAEPATETLSFRFKYEGSALKSDAGARKVYAELTAKARNACRADERMTIVQRRTTAACANHLVNQTVATINSPRLSQVHTGLAAIQFAAG